jgi:hypothetical protein
MRLNFAVPANGWPAILEPEISASDESPFALRDRLARLTAEGLAQYGYGVRGIDDYNDPEIAWVELRNIRPFVLKIGFIVNDGRQLCVLFPGLPWIRVWLRKVSTMEVVRHLGKAVEDILLNSGMCSNVRWWTEQESRAVQIIPDRPPALDSRTDTAGD